MKQKQMLGIKQSLAVNSNIENIGVVLLAAGASTRLGRPKQLLPYNGGSLLQHTLQVALAFNSQRVVVVLGANADTVQHEIKQHNVHVIVNAEWEEGMASSIRCGIKTLVNFYSAVEGVILMVCDQPFVTASLFNEMVAAHQKTGKVIVACSYENTFGPPVFFHCSLFEELLQLKGNEGARGVIRKHANAVEVIPFPDGKYDVDTEMDYERLKSSGRQ
jgi:molybdenum cofactor cytidylyltransferase